MGSIYLNASGYPPQLFQFYKIPAGATTVYDWSFPSEYKGAPVFNARPTANSSTSMGSPQERSSALGENAASIVSTGGLALSVRPHGRSTRHD
jgi:hypothetical protein